MAEQDKKDLPEELPAPLLQFPCEFPMKLSAKELMILPSKLWRLLKNTPRTLTPQKWK